jgi:hypothetical protein
MEKFKTNKQQLLIEPHLNSRQQQRTATTKDTFVPDPIDTGEKLISMEENLLQYDRNPSLQNEFKSDRENRVSFKLC